jgi:hypothetical protein
MNFWRSLLGVLLAGTVTGMTQANPNERVLFDFKTTQADWFVINDGVMGGVSSSSVRVQNGTLVFAGRVRLENNGGFASVRSAINPVNLRGFDGLVLRLRGDGKSYALNLSTGNARNVLYRAGFQTRDGEWLEVRIPFLSLRPTRFGNVLSGPAFDAAAIETFGFIIANQRAETFQLEVSSIRAYRN